MSDAEAGKHCAFVGDLILPKDGFESERCEDDRQSDDFYESKGSPILGHYFQLPDLAISFDLDPPTLDSTLPYIPVYAHLKTFELTPIERPITPPSIHKLRSSAPTQSKYHSGWMAVPAVTGSVDGAARQVRRSIISDTEKTADHNKIEETMKNNKM